LRISADATGLRKTSADETRTMGGRKIVYEPKFQKSWTKFLIVSPKELKLTIMKLEIDFSPKLQISTDLHEIHSHDQKQSQHCYSS
jgi:hypothetical protein